MRHSTGTAIFFFSLVALLAFAGVSLAENAFPPAPRTIENSSFWTSVQKECDTAWLKFFKELGAPPADKAAEIAAARKEGLAARASAAVRLAAAAAEYYAAGRGPEIYERYKKYGSKIKFHDVGVMQAGIALYCDVAALLADGKADEVEKLLADRATALVDLSRFRSRLDADLKTRYFDITARYSAALFGLVKSAHDLAAARKAFAPVSKACAELAREFYLPAPSSVEIFFFEDSEGRTWLSFEDSVRSPYGGTNEGVKRLVPERDGKLLAKLLEKVREAEAAYREATWTPLKKIAALLPPERGRKLLEDAGVK